MVNDPQTLTIGAFAKAAGVNVETIRFYQRKGLLPEPGRPVGSIRRYGSAALDLAYVAAGRYEGFWEQGLYPWDMAAGIVLVREAGGFVSDFNGRSDMLSSGTIIASNDAQHGVLRKLLKQAGG